MPKAESNELPRRKQLDLSKNDYLEATDETTI